MSDVLDEEPPPPPEPDSILKARADYLVLEMTAIPIVKKFHAVIDTLLNQCIVPQGATFGVQFDQGRGDRLVLATEAFRNFAEAQAARMNMLKPPAQHVNLSTSTPPMPTPMRRDGP